MRARNRKTGAEIVRVVERVYAHTDINATSFRRGRNHDGIEYDHADAGTEVDYDSREVVKFVDANLEECQEDEIELVASNAPSEAANANA